MMLGGETTLAGTSMINGAEQLLIGELNLSASRRRDHFDELFRIQNTPKQFYLFAYERFTQSVEAMARNLVWC